MKNTRVVSLLFNLWLIRYRTHHLSAKGDGKRHQLSDRQKPPSH
jgi:hypothetical protein